MELAGKTAVITGAASGIGRAACRELPAHGASVVVAFDVDDVGLDETRKLVEHDGSGATVHVATVDAADGAGVRAALEAALGDGQVDLLLNVAGIIRRKLVLESTTEDVLELMRANLGSVVTMAAAVVPRMPVGGVVINTSSSSADHVARAMGLYGASKIAINHVTKALAQECAERGIRVCAIAPGAVDTPMPRGLLADSPDPDRTLLEVTKATQLIHRISRPEEIVALMRYVAGPEGAFITGTTIRIDGGSQAKL